MTGEYLRIASEHSRRACNVRTDIWPCAAVRARVYLPTLLRLPLVPLLLLLSLRLQQVHGLMDATLSLILALLAVQQAAGECKNCVNLGKEEKAMFRAHSEACLSESHVDPTILESMLRGQLVDDPALRRHVYCVLLKCKVIGKDGKMQKAAVLGKLAARSDGRNVTKVLESCADQRGDSPEDVAWNLFRCGYDKKAVLFDYMPVATDNDSTS